MKKLIYLINNQCSLIFSGGIAHFNQDLYATFPDFQFIEFYLKPCPKQQTNHFKNLKTYHLDLKNNLILENLKNQKIFFTFYNRKLDCLNLEKIAKDNQCYFFDHGTFPKTYFSNNFKNLPINKKLWAYKNYYHNSKMKSFFKYLKIITFSQIDYELFPPNQGYIFYLPFLKPISELRNLYVKQESRAINLISIGRVSKQKNTLKLFKYFSLIPPKKVMITTPFEYRYKFIIYKFFHRDIDYYDNIQNQQVLSLLANSQALLLISRWEGFPRVVIEALLLGVKIFSTNSFSFSEKFAQMNQLFIIDNQIDFQSKFINLDWKKWEQSSSIITLLENSNKNLQEIILN